MQEPVAAHRTQGESASPSPAAPGARSRLEVLAQLARKAQSGEVARQAQELAQRVAEGRFYLACVGQMKRGKSTLVNALVGEALLPTGVVPITSAVTVLRQGPATAVRVWFEDGRSLEVAPAELARYVTEASNPDNEKGVRAVEVFHPSPLLAGGLCLVDTPGLGSIFRGNAAVTRGFVPHLDAALLVTGADPPLSEEEVALAEEVAREVAHLVVVLNKADRVPDADRAEAARFASDVLSRRLGRAVGAVLAVSAAERLERGAPTRDWDALLRAVEGIASGPLALVQRAEARGVERLAQALLRELGERRAALVEPEEESARRLAGLRQSMGAAERALLDLGVLLSAEEGRLAREFRARHESLLPEALRLAQGELEAGLRALHGPRRALRRRGYELAREVASRAVEAFRREVEPAAEEAYRRSTERFVALANEFLARAASSGEPGLEGLPKALEPEPGFRAPSALYYTQLMYLTSEPLPWLLDLVRSRERTLRALGGRVGHYLGRVLESNRSRVANDLAERVAASRVRLEAEVRGALRRLVAVAEEAIEGARLRRAEGAPAVERELERLRALSRRAEALLEPPAPPDGTRAGSPR